MVKRCYQALNYAINHGGLTLDVKMRRVNPPQGYAVSCKGGYEVRLLGIEDIKEVLNAIEVMLNLLDELEDELSFQYLGLYYDKPLKRLYIDKTAILDNESNALKVASEHEQLSIYDFKYDRVINLKDKERL